MTPTEKPPIEPAPDAAQAYIFRPYITLPDGTKLWAKQRGKKAFRIPVGANDNRTKDAV